MWVAKNKGERARPSLFYHKPSRLNDHEWYAHGSDYGYPLYDEHQFDSLTWEDEPIEVKLVPVGFDVIEMPSEEDYAIWIPKDINTERPIDMAWLNGFTDCRILWESKIVK